MLTDREKVRWELYCWFIKLLKRESYVQAENLTDNPLINHHHHQNKTENPKTNKTSNKQKTWNGVETHIEKIFFTLVGVKSHWFFVMEFFMSGEVLVKVGWKTLEGSVRRHTSLAASMVGDTPVH